MISKNKICASPDIQLEGGLNEETTGVSAYMTQEMITDSIAICKTTQNPVKLSWDNLNYEVEIKVSAKDAAAKDK